MNSMLHPHFTFVDSHQFLKSMNTSNKLSSNNFNKVIGIVRNQTAVQTQLDADKLNNVRLVTADLTSPSALASAAQATAELTDGAIDYLIVNGAYVSEDTQSLTPTSFIGKEELFKDDLMTSSMTNVVGVLYIINTFLPLIRAGSIKKIIVISSGMADPGFMEIAGVPQAVTYTTSKAAANILVTKYAIELKD